MKTIPLCDEVRSRFSIYLDGAVTGGQMQAIAAHLEACPGCSAEFADAQAVQQTLSSLRPVRAPRDLGMKLRIAISHEQAKRRASWLDDLSLRWQNAVRPMLLQVSAGLAGAVVLVGSVLLLLGLVATPPVMANDEPLGALTAPHYLYSAESPRPITTDHDTTIVVEVRVNDRGQVYDYHIVSGPSDPVVRSQVTDQLLGSVFEPARVFGGAVSGQAVMTFSGISVHG